MILLVHLFCYIPYVSESIWYLLIYIADSFIMDIPAFIKGAEKEREIQDPKQSLGSELSTQSLTRGSNPGTTRS